MLSVFYAHIFPDITRADLTHLHVLLSCCMGLADCVLPIVAASSSTFSSVVSRVSELGEVVSSLPVHS